MVDDKRRVKLRRTTWKPAELLQFAEDQAVKSVKTLQQWQAKFGERSEKASGDDAVSLARTIAALAAFGRQQSAEQAIVIAGKVELLLDCLANEMDELLASKK